VIVAAIVLLAAGGACFLARIVLGPSLADRVVALDALVATIVAEIILVSVHEEGPWYLDVALIVAFVGFAGTTAAARFIERRGG
jgi:multisubunit Na+/H+ antiporter MnhF subunit